MNRSQLRADRLYYDDDKMLYFVSPDGYGVIWYDSLADVFEAYGKEFNKVHRVSHLTDW